MTLKYFKIPEFFRTEEFPVEKIRGGYRVIGSSKTFSKEDSNIYITLCLMIGIYLPKYTSTSCYQALKTHFMEVGLQFGQNILEDNDHFPIRKSGRGFTLSLRYGKAQFNEETEETSLSKASESQLFRCCTVLGICLCVYTIEEAEISIKRYILDNDYQFINQITEYVDPATSYCEFPGCRNPVMDSHCTCCGVAGHKRFAYVDKWFELFKQRYDNGDDLPLLFPTNYFGMLLAEALKEELCKPSKNNKLQPSSATLTSIQNFFQNQQFRNLNDLLEYFLPYLDLLQIFVADARSIVFPVNGDIIGLLDEDLKVKNQWERGEIMGENICKGWVHRFERVPFMDGHGVILLSCLKSIKRIKGRRFLQNLHLDWVDIDEDTSKWHEIVFPCKNLTIHVGDVFHVTKTLIDRHGVNRIFPYFNFCGISKSFDNLVLFLKESKLPLQMVSFSTARRAKQLKFDERLMEACEGTDIMIELLEFIDGAQRNDFFTFLVKTKKRSILRKK